jgi:antitoxin component YwqK of YwqJK toxin-antitoxin module
LLSETNYVNGVRHAEYKRYYESGALSEKITYNLGDRVAYEDYTEDGKTLKGKISYFEEGIDGKRYSYSNEGKLQMIRIYEMGRLIGYSYLDKNKKEIPMIPLVNETGKIVAYFDNGKKSRELEYVNGQLENDYLQYYYSGKLHHKKHFKGNNFYGKSEEFFSNGKLKKETNFHNDDYHGDRKEYYSNGQLKEVKRYVNDEKSGEAKYFDENGELLRTEYYFNDKIYKVEE